MRTSKTRLALTIIGSCMALSLLLSSCGGRGVEDTSVRARNLATGEIQTFASEGDVPEGWAPCPDTECSVPPAVPCEKLSTAVCTMHPNCRLKELWCTGTVTVNPDGSSDPTPPPTETCEYACIPKYPLLCEELTDEQQCKARADCDWQVLACPMICMDDGKGGCLPCPETAVCVTKAPPICQVLDEKQCLNRSDCEWLQGPCPMAPCTPDGVCPPCPFSCQPKNPLPPPPPPPPCQTIPAPDPSWCKDGTIVPKYDAAGCVVGYDCKPGTTTSCFDLNDAYVKAVQDAKACLPYSTGMTKQCSLSVDTQLMCPLCTTFVNPANTKAIQLIKDIESKFQAQKCDQLEIACPAIACADPKSASCVSDTNPAGTTGQCVDDPTY